MVNANEWLYEKIPVNQRAQATNLYIYRQCQSGHTVHQYNCNNCVNKTNCSTAPTFQFYGILLEGELDLNDFVNLQQLYIYGTGQNQDQQQKLTSLKIDKCNKLERIAINYNSTFIYNLFGENDSNFNRIKSQVDRLTSIIRNVKGVNLSDLKLAAKKIEEENLENQLVNTKNKLNEDNQLWLELLLETQQEVLQNDNAFARKQLEKVKKRLSKVLTAEEIQDFLGKKVEINELEIELNNLKIQESQND
ncbi:10468_t:CDS:1 [Scutellospora calospora]|uniref:10468_t:CDS:1 n=1 Tax=Scutellospora calospora TaxID=85575 RepID=A0ACA9NGL1_9GLOM|nr:10468_t:CDS:1 [Scutellospora calospora]